MVQKMLNRARYGFDNIMSKGLVPLITLMVIVTLIFIVLMSTIVSVFKLYPLDSTLDFGEVAWDSLLRTLDPGTMGSDTGVGFRAAMLLVTLFGVVLVASLIGIISNSFSAKIENLRKGKSKVIEKNHTLILGWNTKALQIVHEISVANQSHGTSAIVILADKDKVFIEEEIHRRLPSLGKTRLVVRSGNPMSKTDLGIVAPHQARSIIILSPEATKDADSFSIKTCLALRGLEEAPQGNCSIVGEIKFFSNLEAAELVSDGSVNWVLGEDLINRLIVQTCRQGGLSTVFTELLDFDGSEIYILKNPSIVGMTYRDVSLALQSSVAMGIINAGVVNLNPPADYQIATGEGVIVVAENDLLLGLREQVAVDNSVIDVPHSDHLSIESTLILGSNSSIDLLLQELDLDSTLGSRVVLISQGLSLRTSEFQNIELQIIDADPTRRSVLEAADVSSFNHVIIVSNRDTDDQQAADARTLLTLLHIRALTLNYEHINIVSEIIDDQNRELAESMRADDFIVSDKIVGHVISQLAENKFLSPVLNSILESEGSRIEMAPIEQFVKLGQPVNFDSLVESALRFGQSAIGFRIKALKSEPGTMHGVRVNPNRTSVNSFTQGDSLIVLSSRHPRRKK